jgi:hypothetical protein
MRAFVMAQSCSTLRHYSKPTMLARLLIGSPETVLVQYTSAEVVDDCSPLQQMKVRINMAE